MSINAKDVVMELKISGGTEEMNLMEVLGLLVEEAQNDGPSTFMQNFNIHRIRKLAKQGSGTVLEKQ